MSRDSFLVIQRVLHPDLAAAVDVLQMAEEEMTDAQVRRGRRWGSGACFNESIWYKWLFGRHHELTVHGMACCAALCSLAGH